MNVSVTLKSTKAYTGLISCMGTTHNVMRRLPMIKKTNVIMANSSKVTEHLNHYLKRTLTI